MLCTLSIDAHEMIHAAHIRRAAHWQRNTHVHDGICRVDRIGILLVIQRAAREAARHHVVGNAVTFNVHDHSAHERLRTVFRHIAPRCNGVGKWR